MTRTTPRVLVTDADRGSAVAVIRSLGRVGWHVVATASGGRASGLRSRYASARFRYPDPLSDPEAMIERLASLARSERIDLVIPVTEEVAVPLSRARDRFEPSTRIALPSAAAFELARDKARVLELAQQHGIPAPRTWTVTAGSDVVVPNGLTWPLVVKPSHSRAIDVGGRTRVLEVSYAANGKALATALASLPAGSTVLLQEYCAGIGVGVELLADGGKIIEAFQHRRLREVPITGGASSYRESMPPDPELLGYSGAMLASLAWTGVAMVEFKVGAAEARLMEINPRLWGSLPLATASGVDFPHRMARLHLGLDQPAQGPTPYQPGVRARNLTLDLHWAAVVLLGRSKHGLSTPFRRRNAVRVLASIVRHPTESDLFALDDLGPQLAELARLPEQIGRIGRGRRR